MLQELLSASTFLLLMPTLAVAYRCRLSPHSVILLVCMCMLIFLFTQCFTLPGIWDLFVFFVCLFSPRRKQENVLHPRQMQSRKNFFSRSGQVVEMMLIVSRCGFILSFHSHDATAILVGKTVCSKMAIFTKNPMKF